MSRDKVLEAEANERATQWLAAVERVPPGDHRSIADFEDIPGQARADSYFWCDQLFTSEANPHRAAPGVRHSFHVAGPGTFDLLRHEYEAEGLCLSVVESRRRDPVRWALLPLLQESFADVSAYRISEPHSVVR